MKKIILITLLAGISNTAAILCTMPGQPTGSPIPWQVTITNDADSPVTLRLFIEPEFKGATPFIDDITFEPEQTKEIQTKQKITGIAPTTQTVDMGSWQQLDLIIENPENKSVHSIGFDGEKWRVVK